MSKIKILHVTGAMNRGGAEIMLMDIFRNLSDDFQFDFLVNYTKKQGIVAGDFDKEILDKKGRIAHIPVQWDIGPSNYIKQFKDHCIALGMPDIVHIHMNIKSGIIALAAKKAGIKHVIVHSHANLLFKGGFVSSVISNSELYFQKKLISKYADYFWGCSLEANLSLFNKNKLTPHNSSIINNAIDVDKYLFVDEQEVKVLKDSFKVNDKTIVLGNIGRIVRQKNVLFIIDVLHELNQLGVDFVFVFAGRAVQADYLEEILNKVKAYGIEDRVKYLGLRSDIPELMTCFDVFLGPSIKEGFGMVAIEAQAAGTPCLLFKDFPETVDMKLGLVRFLNDFKTADWVAGIKAAPLRLENKEQIRSAFESKSFDIKKNTKTIEDLYLKILNAQH